jgi:hypothetical protein
MKVCMYQPIAAHSHQPTAARKHQPTAGQQQHAVLTVVDSKVALPDVQDRAHDAHGCCNDSRVRYQGPLVGGCHRGHDEQGEHRCQQPCQHQQPLSAPLAGGICEVWEHNQLAAGLLGSLLLVCGWTRARQQGLGQTAEGAPPPWLVASRRRPSAMASLIQVPIAVKTVINA